MFLDERFTHKEISHKVHRPTRSKNARHILVWVYRKLYEHILYAFWASYTLCLCWFCAAKASLRSSPAITPFCVLISQNVAHASDSNDYACVMGTWLWFATERKKNQAGISTWASPWKARVIKYNAYLNWNTITFNIWSYIQKLSFLPHSGRILLEREYVSSGNCSPDDIVQKIIAA